MKELHQLVNIIPVIAKADTLTQKEIKALKQTVSVRCQSLCVALVASGDHWTVLCGGGSGVQGLCCCGHVNGMWDCVNCENKKKLGHVTVM